MRKSQTLDSRPVLRVFKWPPFYPRLITGQTRSLLLTTIGCRSAHLKKLLKRSDVATCRPRRRARLPLAAPAFPHRHRGSAAPAPRRCWPVAQLRPRFSADRLPNALRVLATSSGTNRPWTHTPAASPAHCERRAVLSWSEYFPAPVCRP
jgi:hypothetical protein